MRVEVDPDACIGSIACEITCPEVFKVVDGVSTVQVEVVPLEAEARCREAADGCPANAIRIVEE